MPHGVPHFTVVRRVLLAFAITLAAFALTVGWAAFAQRRAAEDSVQLSRGYVPLALKLAQLRATQATISSLVDGIPEERNPAAMRVVLESLTSARQGKLAETKAFALEVLGGFGRPEPQRLSARIASDLESIGESLAVDPSLLDRLFAALAASRRDEVGSALVALGQVEHDADGRLRLVAAYLGASMDEHALLARDRQNMALRALAGLSILTVLVAVALALHVRSVLRPLGHVSARARAVAEGDLTPRPPPDVTGEIGELASTFENMVRAVGAARQEALANERFVAVGRMAAHVTHEIRNPLSSIGLNLELLEEELPRGESEGRSLLSAISREVTRLERLSEEYLRVARAPSVKREAGSFSEVAEEVLGLTRREFEQSGCELHAELEPDALGSFDDAQMRQVLLNLLRNAREAMPDGGRIELRVFRNGSEVVLEVSDQGAGVPDSVRSRIFEPFFSTKGTGTGLGLAVVQQIVKAHGGHIRCETREGGGTTFALRFPQDVLDVSR